MDKYKKTVRRCIFLTILPLALSAILYVVLSTTNGLQMSDFVKGYLEGMFIAFELGYAALLFYLIYLSNNEKRLKKAYIAAADERKKQIASRSLSMVGRMFFVILPPAVIVAGFLNETVFFTLLAVLLFFCFTVIGSAAYFRHKL